MKKKNIISVVLSLAAMSMLINTYAVSALETVDNENMEIVSGSDHYGQPIEILEGMKMLDIDTSVHYRANEDLDYDVRIYAGEMKNGNEKYGCLKTVDLSSRFSFKVLSDESDEEIQKIIRKYFDIDNDDHLVSSPGRSDVTGLKSGYVYSVYRTDSQDLIDFQSVEALFEELNETVAMEYFRFSPAYTSIAVCGLSALEYKEEDFDSLSAFIEENKLPCQVSVKTSEEFTWDTEKRSIVNVDEGIFMEQLFIIRDEIYKNTGLDCRTDFSFEESLSLSTPAENTRLFEHSGKIGDINNDSNVDVTDLSELSLALVGDKTLTEIQHISADVNRDGKAELSDLARMRQYVSRIITSLS